MRFRDVVADFLQSRCDLRSVRTDGYRMPYLVELLGDMPLAKILEQHLERAIETLMATPVARGKSTRKRKPGTKRAYKALIRAFFGWTTRTGRTTSNPSLHMKLPRVDDQRTRLISPDECAAIGRHLSSVSPKVRLLLLLLMALGVRVGEALGARWPDVDETNATLMLPRTKPGPPRQVPLPPEALAVIAELRKFRRNEWLFPAERGDGHMVNPNKAFLGLLAAAGIKESTWVHDLRRLVATEMSRQEGTSIDDVRQLLGHAHLRTTQRYLVGSPERVRAGLAATSGLIHARLGFDQAASPSATNDDSKEE
jgi:integrase